ncbi:shikimate dehydrogenase [Oscillospiraceae bacterium MB08-C2-2]|nr:shikimate dehydrogenase [Oscillospiraceae bacterium MB08-C2-2]
MKLYALLRKSPLQTHSPFIHNRLMELLGIDGQYGAMEIPPERIPKVVDALKVLGYGGINITIPYKQAIMPYLDEISPEAQAIGAVNTVKIEEDGRSRGFNTDYFGFGVMLERSGIYVKGKGAVLLGAGGAAKALIAYLQDHGASSILVAARSPEKLAILKEEHPVIETCSLNDTEALKGSLLINATPVGQPPLLNDLPVPREVVEKFEAVADIISTPPRTILLELAGELGLKTAGGLAMVVYQACKAEEIFHQCSIDPKLSDQVYRELEARLSTQ